MIHLLVAPDEKIEMWNTELQVSLSLQSVAHYRSLFNHSKAGQIVSCRLATTVSAHKWKKDFYHLRCKKYRYLRTFFLFLWHFPKCIRIFTLRRLSLVRGGSTNRGEFHQSNARLDDLCRSLTVLTTGSSSCLCYLNPFTRSRACWGLFLPSFLPSTEL